MLKYFLIISIIFLNSCSYKPVLGDNIKYQNTSLQNIDRDIENCEKKAKNHLKGLKASRVAKEGARKGILGAIFGALLGIFTGDFGQVVKSTAVGAGVGAGVGMVSVASEGSLTKDQIKRNYVTNCLNKKGYSIIGWQ